MIYQIHFPTLNPFSVLRLRMVLECSGYSHPTVVGVPSYHVHYLVINQEAEEYAVCQSAVSGIPTVEWTDNLSAELELVPNEMWEQYIAGAI